MLLSSLEFAPGWYCGLIFCACHFGTSSGMPGTCIQEDQKFLVPFVPVHHVSQMVPSSHRATIVLFWYSVSGVQVMSITFLISVPSYCVNNQTTSITIIMANTASPMMVDGSCVQSKPTSFQFISVPRCESARQMCGAWHGNSTIVCQYLLMT